MYKRAKVKSGGRVCCPNCGICQMVVGFGGYVHNGEIRCRKCKTMMTVEVLPDRTVIERTE